MGVGDSEGLVVVGAGVGLPGVGDVPGFVVGFVGVGEPLAPGDGDRVGLGLQMCSGCAT